MTANNKASYFIASFIEGIIMKRQSDQIRSVVLTNYLKPKLQSGASRFSVSVRDVLGDLVKQDFPANRIPLVCAVLQGKKFLKGIGLEVEQIDGPPSKQSPTVVVHYRVVNNTTNRISAESNGTEPKTEDPKIKAKRLTEKVRGILKEELAEYGGGEAFLRWVRSEDEDAA